MQFIFILSFIVVLGVGGTTAAGQKTSRSFPIAANGRVEIVNHFGRVEVTVDPASHESSAMAAVAEAVLITADSSTGVAEADLKITASTSLLQIEVSPKDRKKRIDIAIVLPPDLRVKIDTLDGEVRLSGDVESAEIRTDTGTIAAAVPTNEVRYSLLWTASRPRYLSDFKLVKIKEKSAGRFQISGTYREDEEADEEPADPNSPKQSATYREDGATRHDLVEQPKGDGSKEPGVSNRVSLEFQTARGIILLNVPPNEVSSDLRKRPLTKAAKAIIRSGDSLLMEAIRRAVPEFYGDYTRSLPPLKFEPQFADRTRTETSGTASVKVASVRVSDVNNQALAGLRAEDFEVIENGHSRPIISVSPSSAPFNLVLLLDVSGSVDNYVNFIRKAARSFVNTVGARDRVAIVTFNDDVHVVSNFSTDKEKLSASLDTFDAGGPTAYYDALAYTLADTLRPLKGERTAIVVLTDGDDNRSFLPFDSMLASIQESGALIYPLYVPSALMASAEPDPKVSLDSLRSRFLQGELTSKAKAEGEKLAAVSGGAYYEISKLSQIQGAYEDIIRQLRTAYEIEYRSELVGPDAGVSPRLRIRTKDRSTNVQVRSVRQK
ncbi:MAG: VWA domain-containing protein [Pyrinomonadaceae bacterium]